MDEIFVRVGQDDPYVDDKIRSALQNCCESLKFIFAESTPSNFKGKLLQWSAYESLDFDVLMSNPESLACSYIIRSVFSLRALVMSL